MKSRYWVFTINNWTSDDEAQLESIKDQVRYLVYGYETGAAGTHHLQGYIAFHGPLTMDAAKEHVGARAHLEQKRGTHEQASSYCKKEGLFKEYGSIPKSSGTNGSLAGFVEWVLSYYADHGKAPSERDVARAYPGLFVRYGRKLQELIEHHCPVPRLEESTELRPWQQALHDILLVPPPDDRSILFYVDSDGGQGKTWFQRYMITNYPEKVQILSCGKRDDIAHAIDPNKSIFLFNIPRKAMEYMNYNVIEQIKDRMIFSPKYDSKTKILTTNPHVVVFSNEYPKMDDMTEDRYTIITDFTDF